MADAKEYNLVIGWLNRYITDDQAAIDVDVALERARALLDADELSPVQLQKLGDRIVAASEKKSRLTANEEAANV